MAESGSFENPVADAIENLGNTSPRSPAGMPPESEPNGLKDFLDSTPYQVSLTGAERWSRPSGASCRAHEEVEASCI